MRESIRRWLVHPRLPVWVTLAAVVTALPALFVGWAGDDWAHRAALGGHPPFVDVQPLWDLFRFLGPGVVNENMSSAGLLTWWADMDVRAAFFRPLSALTHILDQQLWPGSSPLQHAHSLVWAAVMTWCGVRFLREEASSPLAAGLAAVFFALEDAHAIPLSWLANRNALITTTFGILAVHAFVRWRRTGAWSMWGACLISLALGLCAGEAALAACAWMGAWVLTRDRPLGRGLASLAGPAVVVVVWRRVYDAMGYGADYSGLYIDPGATPLTWVQAGIARWPVLAGGQLLSAPIDGWGVLPPAGRLAMTLAGLGVVVAVGMVALPTLRDRPSARTAALAFGLILVPSTATFPMERLLTFASLASAMWIAEMVDYHGVFDAPAPATSTGSAARLRSWAVLGLFVWHAPFAALARPVRCAATPLMGLVFDIGADTAPTDATLEDQTLVYVHANEFAAIYTYVKRSVPPHDHGRPASIALLSTWWTDVEVVREDAHTLVLTPDEGFLARPIDHLLRDPVRRPFQAGAQLTHQSMVVDVRSVTPDGRPAVVAFRFPQPLEALGSHRFVTLGLDGVEPWPIPAIGSTSTLVSPF